MMTFLKQMVELINPLSNFTLQSTSPAINAGTAIGAPSIEYVGTARPQQVGMISEFMSTRSVVQQLVLVTMLD